MSGFSPVFGGGTVQPADLAYQAFTMTANLTLSWPNVAATSGDSVAAIMELTASSGLAALLPDARQATNGQQILIRNVGSYTINIQDTGGNSVGNVAAGESWFFYLKSNATANGTWAAIMFGAATSAADAATLAGMGLKAITTTLNQSHQVTETSALAAITSSERAAEVTWTAGTIAVALPSAAAVGSDFFFIAKNAGSGTITLTPVGADTIDGAASLALSPNDGCFVFSAGSSNTWYTVGKGQAVAFAFTQLVKSVAGSANVTLSASEAANKIMQFTGILTGDINVVFPNTISVYYLFNNTTGAFTLTAKTSAGSSLLIDQGTKNIVIVDGTNLFGAVTNIAATTAFNFGTAGSPSITFIADTDTGIYHPATNAVGIAAGGIQSAQFNTAASAVNYLSFTPSATTAPVIIAAAGTDTNIGINVAPKGSGVITLGAASSNHTICTTGTGYMQFGGQSDKAFFRLAGVASAANQNGFLVTSAGAGISPVMSVADIGGTGDATISMIFGCIGAGVFQFKNRASSWIQFEIVDGGATTVCWPQASGGVAGANCKIAPNTNNLILGTGAAITTNAIIGHIMIPSCAGAATGAVTGAAAGQLPFIYDSTNNKFMVLSGGTWRSSLALDTTSVEQASWTPVLTFATPGNLAVTYSAQSGVYTKIGKLVFLDFQIATSAFTWTTSSGAARITGLPYAAGATANYNAIGVLRFAGITKATYTQFGPILAGSSSYLELSATGSALVQASVLASDMPSAGTIVLRGSILYMSAL